MPLREADVADVWGSVLGLSEVDVTANFFDLGGNSLLLLKLIAELQERLDVHTNVLALLEAPSVAAFTSHWNSVTAADQR